MPRGSSCSSSRAPIPSTPWGCSSLGTAAQRRLSRDPRDFPRQSATAIRCKMCYKWCVCVSGALNSSTDAETDTRLRNTEHKRSRNKQREQKLLQSVSQSINQSINQSTYQPASQSINKFANINHNDQNKTNH